MGTPDGNSLAPLHGVRSFLVIGKLPVGTHYLARILKKFARALETEVTARREPTLYDGALIQTAVRHEAVCQLWLRYLRREADSLTVDQKLAVCKSISSETDARDRTLKALGLDARNAPPQSIYAETEKLSADA